MLWVWIGGRLEAKLSSCIKGIYKIRVKTHSLNAHFLDAPQSLPLERKLILGGNIISRTVLNVWCLCGRTL